MQNPHAEDPDPVDARRPEPSGGSLLWGFLRTARAVLLNPRAFFGGMQVQGGLVGPYVFFFFCTAFSFLVSAILSLTATRSLQLQIVPIFLLALVMPFISAALLQFFLAKMFGTAGSYEATFRVVCYANAVNLLAWIPVVFILIFLQFYEIYLAALGLSIVHRTGIGKSLLAVVGTALTMFLAVVLIAQIFMVT